MDEDDVAPGEMRWFRPHRDEIDAVLGDDLLDEDLADVAAIVHDLRSAYLREEPVPRHAALRAFTATPLDDNGDPLVTAASNAHGSAAQTAGLPNREPNRRKNKMLETVSALVATVAGKVVLGTAVAAASVGGLHAADVVEVPGLPEQSSEQAVSATDEAGNQSQDPEEVDGADESGEPAEEAADGQETAEAAQAKKDAAAAFTADMEEWSTCAEEAGEAELNPVEECGDRPHPSDYGLTQAPTSQADDRGRPETTPADDRGRPEATPAPDAASQGADNDPSDRGTNTPPQPPADDAATNGADNDPSDRGTNTPPQPPADDAATEGADNDPTARGTSTPARP